MNYAAGSILYVYFGILDKGFYMRNFIKKLFNIPLQIKVLRN